MSDSSIKSVNLNDIISAIENVAPLALQENWDNSGLQVGNPSSLITGVLTSVDVTPEVVDEAKSLGANLVVSHHPLLFKGVKTVTGSTRTEKTLIASIKNDIAVYSCHTPLDKAYNGLSWQLARLLGLKPLRPLIPMLPDDMSGLGVICGTYPEKTLNDFLVGIRNRFPHMRHSSLSEGPKEVKSIAICTGSGGSLIDDVIKADCQLYITGDLRHHDFVDFSDRIILVDCGHYETEKMAKHYLAEVISNAFPQLPVYISQKDKNSIEYN